MSSSTPLCWSRCEPGETERRKAATLHGLGRRKVTVRPRAPAEPPPPGRGRDEKVLTTTVAVASRHDAEGRGPRTVRPHPDRAAPARSSSTRSPPPHCLRRPGGDWRAGRRAGRRAGAAQAPPRPDLAGDSPPTSPRTRFAESSSPERSQRPGWRRGGAGCSDAADWLGSLIDRRGSHSRPPPLQRAALVRVRLCSARRLGSARLGCAARLGSAWLGCAAADRLTGVR